MGSNNAILLIVLYITLEKRRDIFIREYEILSVFKTLRFTTS